MKKIFLLLTLLTISLGFTQKRLEIYNYSSKTMNVYIIVTKPTTGTFPWFASVSPTTITIPAGGQYILQNNSSVTRFPFSSSLSSPVITNWRKVVQVGSGSSFTNVTSANAWPQGDNQVFSYLSFTVNNGAQSGGNIGELGPNVSTVTLPNYNYNWEADYDNFTNGTTIINTVVFYDI